MSSCRRLATAASLALVALVVSVASQAGAQAAGTPTVVRADQGVGGAKKILSVDDYDKWRTVEGTQISADGRWVAAVLRHANVPRNESKPELHLRDVDTDASVVIAHASNPLISSDSRWIAYQVDSMPQRAAGRGGRAGGAADAPADTGATPAQTGGARGRGAAPTPLRRYELRELATGATQAWKDIQSATFAETSKHLVLRRAVPGAAEPAAGRGGAPGGGGGGGGRGGSDASSTKPRGVDVILVDLSTGRTQLLGSVGDIEFNRLGDMLAYDVDAAVDDANGLFVIDFNTGRTHALDNGAKRYSRLEWSADGEGLAVLKGSPVERMRERTNVLVAFPSVRAAIENPTLAPAMLDAAKATGWERGWVLSERAPLAWSEDKQRVFFGAKMQVPVADTGRRPSTDSIADVDVWRTEDTRIQSAQMIRASQEQNFTFTQAFEIGAGKFVRLADTTMRALEVSLDGKWAVGRDTREYFSDYKPAAADFYRVNTTTGERTLMLKAQLTAVGSVSGISPDGRTFLYWKDSKYQAFDLDAGSSRTIGGKTAPSFIDREYDHPGPKPAYGVVAWTPDGKGVVVEDRYDVWLLPLDGSDGARNITQGLGAKGETHFRWFRADPVSETDPRAARSAREIDLSKPVTFATYGEFTKKAGFARLDAGKITELVYDDAAYSTPVRAAKADRFLFTRQTFAEFPDVRVSGLGFSDSRTLTNANPQQAEFKWGRRILFDYKIKDGRKLQGLLTLPEDYKQGEKRPMIVSFYEKNSQNMNRYTAPSFLTGMGSLPIEAVSRGYITMLADIHFHTGSSHSDMLEAVEAATRKVIEMGYVDPAKIAVHGHSYGGEGAAFIGTRSKLFAAVGMGAGVTDLYSDFSQSWGWSYQVEGGSGENGNQYYLYGQGRWGVSPWDDPELYRSESALANAPNASAPFLIMHGTADPTVAFSEGMNFYNALRYNGKNAVMLAYPGEGHGLRGLANRRDLTERYFQFFDHYLKGAPAPKWMTDGVPFLAKKLPIVP
ncbi:MAG: prolyl oligopeptidase family serine peptidase [Gemmatimonadetes bacterium]|nr:prolyl oligopeptidase family serine peptidase [Gemmatimonadota bacterium]